jgi:hypothetical protein
MRHSYDHITLLVSFFNIPVSLDSLFQSLSSSRDGKEGEFIAGENKR